MQVAHLPAEKRMAATPHKNRFGAGEMSLSVMVSRHAPPSVTPFGLFGAGAGSRAGRRILWGPAHSRRRALFMNIHGHLTPRRQSCNDRAGVLSARLPIQRSSSNVILGRGARKGAKALALIL